MGVMVTSFCNPRFVWFRGTICFINFHTLFIFPQFVIKVIGYIWDIGILGTILNISPV